MLYVNMKLETCEHIHLVWGIICKLVLILLSHVRSCYFLKLTVPRLNRRHGRVWSRIPPDVVHHIDPHAVLVVKQTIETLASRLASHDCRLGFDRQMGHCAQLRQLRIVIIRVAVRR